MKKLQINFNKTFNKNEIKTLINWFLANYGSLRTQKLLDKLKEIGFKYATIAGISLGLEDLKIPPIKKVLFENTEKSLNKSNTNYLNGKITITKNIKKITEVWNNTNETLKNEVLINFRQTDLLNPLYMMTLSGARGNISQIKQLVGMRGLMSDSQGEIINLPIKSNFKEGLTLTEYFISCYGARKGLVDTALKTANSGYLTRRLVYVSQSQIIKKPNCYTKYTNLILTLKKNKQDYKSSKEKLIGRVLGKSIVEKKTNKIIASYGQDICNYLVKKIIFSKKIYIKSPLTCKLNTGICQLCYGWNLGNGRMAELGESVGVLAAQSIGEPGTQLTMRTFHTGGVFSGEVAKNILAPHEGIIKYNIFGGKNIITKYKENGFLTLKEKKIILVYDKIKKFSIKIPKNTIIFTKPNEKVFPKQIIAQITKTKENKKNKRKKSKEIKEIKSTLSGQLFFDESKFLIKNFKYSTIWILSGNITSYISLYKQVNNSQFLKVKLYTKEIKNKIPLKIKISLKKLNSIKKKSEEKKLLKINYLIEKNIYEKKQIITKKIKTEKLLIIKNDLILIKLGKFILKEAKINNFKNDYSCQLIQKNINYMKVRKTKPHFLSKDSKINKKNYSAIKKNNNLFYTYYKKQKTEDIVQGLPKIEELLEAKKSFNLEKLKNNPHDKLNKNFKILEKKYKNSIAVRKTIEKMQNYLIKKIQSVYKSQGVSISDKHMEIIVREMTSKVIIYEEGDSNFIIGEIVELNKIEKINEKLKNKIKYQPILMGISQLSLNNQSFISAASFQETTKVLTKAAVEGKVDWLYGLKENIILGNLIPTGSGYKQMIY
uniref:DNA-directed RNA polymerase n=1 Tax=Euglena viridis TaxID=3040 RepID=M1EUS9_EUGVI|nr:RNA polymerase beta'' subunit [Euglena viridis]AEY70836.2 RNA polymerase beta'' subunit [Euglena viridis]